jgi:hypothetical protein
MDVDAAGWDGFAPDEPDLWAPYDLAPAPGGSETGVVAGIADCLDAVETFLRRFVVFGRPEAVVAVVLWIAHTYALAFADATPYLGVTSPEKGSGKTRLLECVGLLAHGRPNIFIIPTAATIYRMLEADPSTPLLLDELDAVFRDRSDKYEEVRALINAGHRRGAKVPRTVTIGNRHVVQFFPVFGPKVLACIGKLPDTITDRSIPIRMVKRKRTETVEKFRLVAASREAEPIALALAAAVRAAPPAREATVPDELPDRAADAWEPLLALADAAGRDWPRRARLAAVILHADRADDDSLGLRLLADTRLVFDRDGADRLATLSLIEALKADDESPWVDDHHPLTPERLARYLKPFGIRSKQLKIAGIKVRGFERESFVDSWDRYLPEPGAPLSGPVPRYPERARGTEVPGYSGDTGPGDQTPTEPPQVSGVPDPRDVEEVTPVPLETVLDFDAPICETCSRRKRAVPTIPGRYVCTGIHPSEARS